MIIPNKNCQWSAAGGVTSSITERNGFGFGFLEMSTDMVVGLLFLAVSCLWLSSARRIYMADHVRCWGCQVTERVHANVINYKRTFPYRVIQNGFFFVFSDNSR